MDEPTTHSDDWLIGHLRSTGNGPVVRDWEPLHTLMLAAADRLEELTTTDAAKS